LQITLCTIVEALIFAPLAERTAIVPQCSGKNGNCLISLVHFWQPIAPAAILRAKRRASRIAEGNRTLTSRQWRLFCEPKGEPAQPPKEVVLVPAGRDGFFASQKASQ